MSTNRHQKLLNYCNSISRNKLVICTQPIEVIDIQKLNIGLELADRIKELIGHKHLTFLTTEMIDELIQANTFNSKEYGDIAYLQNVGVLLEPSLKINFLDFIQKNSKSKCLVIDWPGEIENNKLYFLSKENGLSFNLSELSHIVL
jgi:hypothetical protein